MGDGGRIVGRVALVVMLILTVLAAESPAGASSTLLPLGSLPPATENTLTYCAPDGVGLQMDLYRPTGWGPAVPVVLQIHGGGWGLGNRRNYVTAGLVSEFLRRGLAFATIDYRLWNAPGASEDVACAVRFLRTWAKQLKIDPAHIGAMGQSAGGQLASLLGTTDDSSGFVSGQYTSQSSRVQAVADEWGPVILDATEVALIPSIPLAFGTSDPVALQRYSPLTYITPDDPPVLLVQGAQDAVVPRSQSDTFAAALKVAGVPARLVLVQHAGHYLAPAGGTPTPTPASVASSVATFFANQLRV